MPLHHISYFCKSKTCKFLQFWVVTNVLLGGLISPFSSASAEIDSGLPDWLQQSMSLADARHLAGRTGLGASADELSALMNKSRIDAVRFILEGLETNPHIPMPAWVDAPAPHFWTRRNLSSSMKQKFNADRDGEIVQLRRWWVNNMLQTSSPQSERLVLFWHDHFATSYDGVNRRSISMARQNRLFREMGTGSYRALLKAVIRDPAMLIYLNNQSNRKGNPNENLARELLELFSLGEGNYDEATVKEAARALTGYGISDTYNLSFKLNGNQRDLEQKTLFGQSANHDGDSLIDLILEQPAAAEHLVKKFWHAFISDAVPNPAFVESISNEFRQSDYDIKHLYTSVLMSEAFWHEENRLALIKSPVNLLIGTARSLDYPKRMWTQFPSLLALLGMDLFSPPNVAGWNEGEAFVIPGRLLNRQMAIKSLLSVPEAPLAHGESPMMDSSVVEPHMTRSSDMGVPDVRITEMSNASSTLQVRLAGHFFKGAPRYKVSLFNASEEQLWTSDVRSLQIGYDTEVFGKTRDMNRLAWQTEHYSPAAEALSKSTSVKIAFLNDAKDKTGDRNLFVDSVSINGDTFDTVNARQDSDCPPKNPRNAGSLKCTGTVAVELTGKNNHSVTRDVPYTASSVSVLRMVQKNKRLAAAFALEYVQTPEGYFHTVSFNVISKQPDELEISLNSYGCWPDCIEIWPQCALIDNRSGQRTVAFPLRRRNNEQPDCHYDSLSPSEQALVNAIYASVPALVNLMNEKADNAKQQVVAQAWRERIAGFDARIRSSVYGTNANPFQVNQQYTQPEREIFTLEDPNIAVHNLETYSQLATEADLTLPELLIGGVPVEQFPDLQNESMMPAAQQLEKLLMHPVYQVY